MVFRPYRNQHSGTRHLHCAERSAVQVYTGKSPATRPSIFLRSERAFPWRAFVIALILRLIPVILARGLSIGLDDMFQYDMLGRSIATGVGYRWYAAPDLQFAQKYMQLQVPAVYDPQGFLTTFRAPLYPAFLALVYWFNGINAGRFFAARLAQALLGACLVPLTYWLARKLFPDYLKAARLAAWMVAFYPLLVIYPLALATENLFFVLLLAALLALAWAAVSRRTRFFVLAGLLLGLAALTRSILFVFVGLAILWVFFWLHERRNALFMTLVFILTIVPWMIRNSLLTGHLTGIETSLGYNLYVGYHPQSTGTFIFGPSMDLLSILDDSERDKLGTQKAFGFIQANPGRFLPLMVYRVGYFFGLERRALTYFYSNNFFGAISRPLLLTVAVLTLTPFIVISCSAAFGLALIRWDKATLLLPLVLVGYLAPHVVLLSEERFHYALVPVFAILAAQCWAGGLAALRARWNESRTGKIALTLGLIAVSCLFFNWTYELLRDAGQLALLFGPTGNLTYFPY
jgi:4-amino-4-deoxy-L-arabinose transferase-like glycosyltransferase